MFKNRGRGRLYAAALVAALAGTALTVPAAFAAGTVPAREIINQSFADPDILKDGSTYYAYATATSSVKIPVATATNPEGPWTVQGPALLRYPTWAKQTRLWAPDVSKRPDGTYLMLFSTASESQDLMCIATATSTSPLGPFVPDDSGPLTCPPDPLHGAIDPSTFTDSDGKHYILFKNNGNAIGEDSMLFIQQVDAAGTTLIGSRTELLRDQAGDGGIIEAPVLIKHDGEYVLFFASGSYENSTYATGYARSDSLKGPYTRDARELLATGITQGVDGPGGADVVGSKIFFHGREAEGAPRTLWVSDLGWSNAGRPVVRGSKFRYEAEKQTKNNVVVKDKSGASGGQVVGNIDNADSWVEIKVTAPVAGSYTMRVGYYAGYGNATHKLTINGVAAGSVSYTDKGWSTRGESAVDITLDAGINTVRLTKSQAYADIDYVDVS